MPHIPSTNFSLRYRPELLLVALIALVAFGMEGCNGPNEVEAVSQDSGFDGAVFSAPAVSLNRSAANGQGVVSYYRNSPEDPNVAQAHGRTTQIGAGMDPELRLGGASKFTTTRFNLLQQAGLASQRVAAATIMDGTHWLSWLSVDPDSELPKSFRIARIAPGGNLLSNETIPTIARSVEASATDPKLALSQVFPGLVVYGFNNAVIARELAADGSIGEAFDIARYANEVMVTNVLAAQNDAGIAMIGWGVMERESQGSATFRGYAAFYSPERGVYGLLEEQREPTEIAVGLQGSAVLRTSFDQFRLYDPQTGWQADRVALPSAELEDAGCSTGSPVGLGLVAGLYVDDAGRITTGYGINCVMRLASDGVLDSLALLSEVATETGVSDPHAFALSGRVIAPINGDGGMLVLSHLVQDVTQFPNPGTWLVGELVFDPVVGDGPGRILQQIEGPYSGILELPPSAPLDLDADTAGFALGAFAHVFQNSTDTLDVGVYTISWAPPRPDISVVPASARPGETVTLVGPDFSDNPADAAITEWSWDVGDDGTVDGTGASVNVTWTGEPIMVRLTVVDDWRITGTTVRTLELAAPDVMLDIDVIGVGEVVSRGGSGIDCQADGGICSARFRPTSREPLEAVPLFGERFIEWGGDCAEYGTILSPDILMDSDRSCTATFSGPVAPERVTVTVGLELDGQPVDTIGDAGRVLGTGIDCSGPGPDCEQEVDLDSVIALRVFDSEFERFNRWISTQPGSACDGVSPTRLEFAVVEPLTCIAQFVSISGPQALLTVFINTSGFSSSSGGRVSSNPAGIEDCGANGFECQADFNGGTAVTLTATPRPGYLFGQWSGDSATPGCAGTALTAVINMNGPRQCGAVFVADTVSGNARFISVGMDLPADERPRVIDTETGLIDCDAGCTISVPVDQSPYLLRQVAPPGRIQSWAGCDALRTDPANPGGLKLCEVDISSQNRSIQVVAP